MKKKIIIAAISLVMLVGCNEVPEDVKSRAEEQWRPIPEEHKELIQYIPLGEMQADIDKALTDTYANFDLREGIKVRLPDQLRQCDFAQVDGFASNAEKVLDAFIDSSDRKGIAIETYEQEAVLDNPHTKTTCRGFRDEDGKRQFIVWENGFVSMFRGAMFDLQLSSPETIKIYHVDRGDDLSDSYKLDKETLTVKEAVDKAQKWIDERYAQFEKDYQIRIHTVKVDQYTEKTEDGSEIVLANELIFLALKEYKGVMLDFSGQKTSREKNEKITKIDRSINDLELRMITDSSIEMVTNGSGMITPSETGVIDKGVSVSSALQYIENTFTNFNEKPKIVDIQLKYTLSPEYDKETQAYNAPGNKLKGRLVWEFTLGLPESVQKEYRNKRLDYSDFGRYVIIDVQNGEMEYEFEY
jgi:hypothetical protein